jgi:hypothetical protein
MLGHKTATMTLDLYGHLFPDRLDELADRMDEALCAPDVRQDQVDPPEGSTGEDEDAGRLLTGPRSSGDRAPLS